MSQRKDAETLRTDKDALNKTASIIIRFAITVHSKLGPGLL
jgi:hypothetical protein